jgi:hypothetical protein
MMSNFELQRRLLMAKFALKLSPWLTIAVPLAHRQSGAPPLTAYTSD